jgi:hypothetical protein
VKIAVWNNLWKFALPVFCLLVLGCQSKNNVIEPTIFYAPTQSQIENLPSAFPPLMKEEARKEWGRELYLGARFACELDYYRAITALKRAQFLIPKSEEARLHQIEFSIVQCYYLGQKYQDAVLAYENSTLRETSPTFPAFKDLLLMLTDAYSKSLTPDLGEPFRCLLEKIDKCTFENLKIYEMLNSGNLIDAASAKHNPELDLLLWDYSCQSKSVTTAETLNAVLPGAGYYYVGQKKAALTSFLINTLFIGAAYYFFDNHNVPAGLITLSLETGWYFGGINGAGIAAKEYNERIYSDKTKEYLIKHKMFPVLMLEKSF